MNGIPNGPRGRRARAGVMRGILASLLASALAAGCDRPFHPFEENTHGPFSMLGYLDLNADTQWVRVMPVRQSLLAGPEPIDAVVTLEHLGTDRTVTLRDSLFRFTDARLDGVAYAHNFWTTERLEGNARYRLRAVRSDGASTTALIDMPGDLEFTFLNLRDTAWVEVRAERVLFVETIHAMKSASGDPGGILVKRQLPAAPTPDPRLHVLAVDGVPPFKEGLEGADRTELHIAAARSDWPYNRELSDLTISLPSTMPSNVENGLGFVGGVATRTVPFHRCTVLRARPDGRHTCALTYSRQSASVAGRVIRQPCGRPHALADIRLTQRSMSGGAVLLRWKTGWHGEYRFEGIEPGAELVLQLGSGTPAVHLPRLAAGQRYTVQDISVGEGC
jgi:hypothetical protein